MDFFSPPTQRANDAAKMRHAGSKAGGGDQFRLQFVQQQIGPRVQQSHDAWPIHPTLAASLRLPRTLRHAGLLAIRMHLEGPRGAYTKPTRQHPQAALARIVRFQKLPP